MLIDWDKIEKVINRYYHKNKTIDGRPAYNGVLLFKMLLLGIWNDLSDIKTENLVNDSLSAMRFCKLSLEDSVPDHSTLSRFRTELTVNNGMDKIDNVIEYISKYPKPIHNNIHEITDDNISSFR